MIRNLFLSAIAAMLLVGSAMAKQTFKPLEADPEMINFGIISTESTQNLRQ